jgi:hypothetical protein
MSEGELCHYSNNNKKFKSGYYFLLNDVFLYTRKKGSRFQLKALFELDKGFVRLIPDGGMLSN